MESAHIQVSSIHFVLLGKSDTISSNRLVYPSIVTPWRYEGGQMPVTLSDRNRMVTIPSIETDFFLPPGTDTA